MVEVRIVEEVVKVVSLFLVALQHSFCSAVLFNPVENLVQNVDCVAWRCVVHWAVVCVCFVSEHCRCSRQAVCWLRNQVFADNYKCNSSRRKVFLRACKQKSEFWDIERFRKNTRRNISNERNISRLRNVFVMSSHDCVVKADISVIVVAFNFFNTWNIRIIFVFWRSDDVNFNAEFFCFGSSFFCPDTSFDVSRLFVVNSQVFCNHCKLCRTAALNKKNLVIFRNVHQFANHSFCIFNNRLIILWTVAHFHNRLTASVIIEHFCRTFF